MKLEPAYLQSRTGFSFFNAGVSHATPEDHLAWYRHFREISGSPPKMLVLGLDLATFSDQSQPDARLLSAAPLSRQITDLLRYRDRAARWTELLSWHQTRESARSWLLHLGKLMPEPLVSFEEDGLLVYRQREKQIEAGEYDFESALNYTVSEAEHQFRDYLGVSALRLAILDRLLTECSADNTRLIVFLTTLHPRQQQHLLESSNYAARKQELRIALAQRAIAHQFTLVDLSNSTSYGGDYDEFVDGIHPLEANTRRMIDKLLAGGAQR
jgi:hypothetical protein